MVTNNVMCGQKAGAKATIHAVWSFLNSQAYNLDFENESKSSYYSKLKNYSLKSLNHPLRTSPGDINKGGYNIQESATQKDAVPICCSLPLRKI